MQVSQLKDYDSHAVIGGGGSEAFSMSDSAEFFTVLSDTLYRDKKRAVIREVVCNAWDAHIAAGKTDTPVEITLTDAELTIKDFGPGIPDHMMGPIYCRYGASTKVLIDSQTGGFGLGSKAPFAYSNHFTVVSSHDGSRTVYAISRGGKITDGKPELRRMVTVPSEETGVTVSIPVLNKSDRDEFESIICSVVQQGGMRAKLNNIELSTWDYEPARKQGFCLLPYSVKLGESSVYLLYGTVLYPISSTDEEVQQAINDAVEKAPQGPRLVLIAPPGSVGITPSRESLSYTPKTIATIKELVTAFRESVDRHAALALRQYADERAKSVLKSPLSMWTQPALVDSGAFPRQVCTDELEIARYCAVDHINEFMLEKEQNELLFRKVVKYARNKRFWRDLANAALIGQWRKNAGKITFRHSAQKHLRLARDTGILRNLVVFNSGGFSPIRSHFASEALTRLVIAPNQRQVAERYKDQYLDGNLIVAILRNPSQELIAQIEAGAAKREIQVEHIRFERPERPSKPAPIESFYSVKQLNNWWTGLEGSKPTSDETPKVFVRARRGSDGVVYWPWQFSTEEKETLKALYPDMGLAFTAREERELLKRGSQPVQQVVAEEIAKIGKSKVAQFAAISATDRGIFYKIAYCSVKDRLIGWFKWDLTVANAVLDTRLRITPEADRMLHLFRFWPTASAMLFSGDADLLVNNKIAAAAHDKDKYLREEALKTFAPLVNMRSEEFKARYAFVNLLSVDVCDPQQRADLLEIIPLLKRRYTPKLNTPDMEKAA